MPDGIAEMIWSYIGVQHLTAEVFQSTIGDMQRASYIVVPGFQTQPEQSIFDNTGKAVWSRQLVRMPDRQNCTNGVP
jgi:hypothetical protein